MNDRDQNAPVGADASGNPVTVRLSPSTVQALETWAAAQPQPLSRDEAVEVLLTDALREAGYMAGSEPQGMRPDELNAENDG